MKKLVLVTIIAMVLNACTQHTNTHDNADTVLIKDSARYDSAIIDNTKTQKDTAVDFATNKLIMPGNKLGKIELGMNDSLLGAELGKADMSDAAMGKAWLTWYGKKPDEHNNKTELNVFTSYKDTSMREKTVQQVRTTSSFFATEKGLHVYSSLKDIQAAFPKIKKAATYTDDGRKFIIYDEQEKGIAFEIVSANEQKICTGIIIHLPGIKVTQIYISLHPDMHIL